MDIQDFFVTRYSTLYDFFIPNIWEKLTHEQIRHQPHPCMNTVAWNLWHMTRAEDAGLNRFVTDGTEVLDDGDWNAKLNLTIRHVGMGMNNDEVFALTQQIDLDALKGYNDAVHQRTLEILPTLTATMLDEVLDEAHRLSVAVDEGYANPDLPGMEMVYQNWTKGECLMHLGLTHNYEHIGVIGTIASLMDVIVIAG